MFLITAFVKLELVEYCKRYPDAFGTLPTVTEIEFAPVELAEMVGAARVAVTAEVTVA